MGDDEVQDENNKRWHHREIRRTSFERSITLPTEVQADHAEAEFENGFLTLHLPKSEEAKPRQIQIGSSRQKSGTNRMTPTR